MLIDEIVIKNLRAGDKNALEKVYNTYHPLYHYLYVQIVFNEQWAHSQLPLFYQEIYEKVPSLADDGVFDRWSIRLLIKHATAFLHSKEEFRSLTDEETHDILKKRYPNHTIIKYLDDDQDFVSVLSILYHVKSSDIGKLYNYQTYAVKLAKRNAEKVLSKMYTANYFEEYKAIFLSHYGDGQSFDDISRSITYVDRSHISKNQISGPLKGLVGFVLIVALIVVVVWLINSIKG